MVDGSAFAGSAGSADWDPSEAVVAGFSLADSSPGRGSTANPMSSMVV